MRLFLLSFSPICHSMYLLVSTVVFSHHCFFHYRHLSTFPLLLLACNIGDFDPKYAPLFSSNHRTSETDKPQSSDFQLSGTGHCTKKPKESKQKNPFSKLLWNFDMIWGYSGDTGKMSAEKIMSTFQNLSFQILLH